MAVTCHLSAGKINARNGPSMGMTTETLAYYRNTYSQYDKAQRETIPYSSHQRTVQNVSSAQFYLFWLVQHPACRDR